MNCLKIIEFVAPSGSGKSTLVKKIIKKEKNKYLIGPEYKTTSKTKLGRLKDVPFLVYFLLKYNELVKEIYKLSYKGKFKKNLIKIFLCFYDNLKLLKNARSKKISLIYFPQTITQFILGAISRKEMKISNNLLKILNKVYYDKYKVILFYLDYDENKIISRKTNRNKIFGDKNLKKIKEQTILFKKNTTLFLEKINYHQVIITSKEDEDFFIKNIKNYS